MKSFSEILNESIDNKTYKIDLVVNAKKLFGDNFDIHKNLKVEDWSKQQKIKDVLKKYKLKFDVEEMTAGSSGNSVISFTGKKSELSKLMKDWYKEKSNEYEDFVEVK